MRKRKEKEHEMITGDGRRKVARTGRKAQVVKNRNTKNIINDKTDETGQQENITKPEKHKRRKRRRIRQKRKNANNHAEGYKLRNNASYCSENLLPALNTVAHSRDTDCLTTYV
jgi:hypothetical protein